MATYYERHRDEMLARQKLWRAANRTAYLDYLAAYYTSTIKPKRNLERVNNPSRWVVKPDAPQPRRRIRHAPAPKPPPLPRSTPAIKSKTIQTDSTPIQYTVERKPGCVISWE